MGRVKLLLADPKTEGQKSMHMLWRREHTKTIKYSGRNLEINSRF
jgi:hypothetical protein